MFTNTWICIVNVSSLEIKPSTITHTTCLNFAKINKWGEMFLYCPAQVSLSAYPQSITTTMASYVGLELTI
jgi:hypothetical protein